MTKQTRVRQRDMGQMVRAGSLCALLVAATACASGDGAPDAVVEVAENVEVVENFESIEFESPLVDTGDPDGPLYGASIDQWSNATRAGGEPVNVSLPGFRSADWEDLVPSGFTGAQILDRYKERLDAAEPGSAELDVLYEEMNAEYEASSMNTELDGQAIQLAGFIAPLTYDGDEITEFLLVPYFGACIHVPAPPANQAVFVALADGERLTLEESWGAVWVAGTLTASTTTHDIGTAGYAMSGAQFGVYESN